MDVMLVRMLLSVLFTSSASLPRPISCPHPYTPQVFSSTTSSLHPQLLYLNLFPVLTAIHLMFSPPQPPLHVFLYY